MANRKQVKSPPIPQAMVKLVREIYPNLRVDQHRETARHLAEEDPAACVLAILREIAGRLSPKEPWSGMRNNLEGAAYPLSVEKARQILDEAEKAESSE